MTVHMPPPDALSLRLEHGKRAAILVDKWAIFMSSRSVRNALFTMVLDTTPDSAALVGMVADELESRGMALVSHSTAILEELGPSCYKMLTTFLVKWPNLGKVTS